MSIVAITAVNKPAPQTSAADSAAADASLAAGGDFANLLLAQLSAGIKLMGDGLPEKAADAQDTAAADSAPPDAAALFAALGLAPPPDSSPKPAAQTGDGARPAGISDLHASTRKTGDGSAQETVALDTDTDGRTAGGLPAIAAAVADDKPAKFAVGDSTQLKAAATGEATPLAETRTPTVIAHAPTQQPTSGTQNSAPLRVETPMQDQKAWASDVGQKIVWMVGNEKQSAQLTLNPPQMGPIEISLNINRDSATALFVSANPEVREALESAMPRLREMLAGAGIELGQANVSAESSRQQQGGNDNARPGASRWMADNAILGGDSGEAAGPGAGTIQRGNGLVDLFA